MRAKNITGAVINNILLLLLERISLTNNFKPSAKGCNKPIYQPLMVLFYVVTCHHFALKQGCIATLIKTVQLLLNFQDLFKSSKSFIYIM